MEDLAILNPYAELEMIPAAGASVFEDQPLRFLAAFNAWVERPTLRQRPVATLFTPTEARAAQQRAEESATPSDATATPPRPEVPDLPEEPETAEIPGLPQDFALPGTPDEPVVPAIAPESNREPPAPETAPETAPEPTSEPGPEATNSTAMAPRRRATSARGSSKTSATTASDPEGAHVADKPKAAPRKRPTATGSTEAAAGAETQAPAQKSSARASRGKMATRAKKPAPPAEA
jgi:hypothetical protein